MRGGPPRAWVLCDSGGGRPHRCSWRGSQDQGRGPRASPLHALLWTRPPIHVHRSWAPRPCSPWVHLPDPMSGWCSGECGACPVPLASPRDHGLQGRPTPVLLGSPVRAGDDSEGLRGSAFLDNRVLHGPSHFRHLFRAFCLFSSQ